MVAAVAVVMVMRMAMIMCSVLRGVEAVSLKPLLNFVPPSGEFPSLSSHVVATGNMRVLPNVDSRVA